jgi:hypothetical protein
LEPHLEKLLRLQEVALAIDKLNRELTSIPARIQDLDQSLARHRAEAAKAKDDLAGHQKERRKLEGDLQAVEAKIGKYQTQLMEVKTNKEYTLMLAEIETVKKERGALETRILQGMEAADALEGAIRLKETALAKEKGRVDATLAELVDRQRDLTDRRAGLEENRKRVEGELPPELVAEFNRISKGRGGLAVVRVVAGLCQGCSVRIQPRIFQQVRRNDTLSRCDSCKRYLYYVEEKSAESPPGA